MCEPKPGPRCSADTRRELQHAEDNVQNAQREADRFPDDGEAQRRLAVAERVRAEKLAAYDSSPEGQRKLKLLIESSQNPHSEDLDKVRTRLYRGRHTRVEQKRALARARGKSAEEEEMDVDHILKRLRQPDGGFTIDLQTNRESSTGFFVSGFPEREKAIPSAQMRRADIRRYREENGDLLSQEGLKFGGWNDPETGIVYLDVSSRVESAEEARTMAREHNQIAYFDGQTGSSVNTDGRNDDA